MQLLRLAAVLVTALPAIASTAPCTEETSTKASDSVIAGFEKLTNALAPHIENLNEYADTKLRKRQEYGDLEPLECTGNETCLLYMTVFCYNEKTTTMRFHQDMTFRLDNGDYTLPDNSKGNSYTDTKAYIDFIKQMRYLPSGDETSSSIAAMSSAASATASSSGTAAAASASQSHPTAANATSSAQASASEDADSAAGKMVVGGWIATVAALAAIVVA